VDDAAVWGLEIREVVNLIKGPEHTTVRLTLRRGDDVYLIELPRAHSHMPELPNFPHATLPLHHNPPPISPRNGLASPRGNLAATSPRGSAGMATLSLRTQHPDPPSASERSEARSWQERMAESLVRLPTLVGCRVSGES